MPHNNTFSEKPLYVAILWHHHQPFYKDLLTKEYFFPWVRLHATKDYYDTAAILDEFPSIKLNFNLVPSLLMQLDDYARGDAREPYLELTKKPAQKLTMEERISILQDFFKANWQNMVEPYPRYNQLLSKRGRHSTPLELKRTASYFTANDFLDLQVWFNLSWMDPYWKEHDEFIGGLFKKGEHFTEEEKNELLNKQFAICRKIPEKYRMLQDAGRIEITTTPMYHPIMPLVIDTYTARDSKQTVNLPEKRFCHPEDVDTQIEKAVQYYEHIFGMKPKGLWPSEGSVAENILPLLTKHGFKWLASDEGILFKSLPEHTSRDILYKSYKMQNIDPPLYMIFRDREISDAISFNYATWHHENAAHDLINKLHQIRKSIHQSREDHLISIILDGENCWEYYKNDGWDFLRALYGKLSREPLLPTVTVSDYLHQHPHAGSLKHLWPGSWINANFNIWIGHQEDNASWDYLSQTRDFLLEHVKYHPEKRGTPEEANAWEEIYIAEGSDWNWWYGDEHSTSDDLQFDKLFRKHLMNVYTFMNERIPDWLFISIKSKTPDKRAFLKPIDLMTPKIDGKITNYYEWRSAGVYSITQAGGTMHTADSIVSSFFYGFDLSNLFFRIDLKIPMDDPIIKKLTFKIVFIQPSKTELIFRILPEGELKEYGLFSSHPFHKIKDLPYFSADKIIECAVPFNDLDTQETFPIEFMLVIEKNLVEIERWPFNDSIMCDKPTRHFKMVNWSV